MTVKAVNASNSSKLTLNLHTMKAHSVLVERLRKSLYYGSSCGKHDIDYPSMPLTQLSVEMFEKTVSSGTKGLDVFDMNFASRVARKACISPTSLMMAMIYLQRLKRKNPEYLRRVSPCDLFLVSIMIASKFLFDDGEEDEVFNDEWASSYGINVKDLNRLEREFLTAIEWNCFVDSVTFMKHLSNLEAFISLHQYMKRGSNGMTYNELLSLFNYSTTRNASDKLLWSSLIKTIAKVFLISSLAYISSIAIAITMSVTIARISQENTRTVSHISNNSNIICNNTGHYSDIYFENQTDIPLNDKTEQISLYKSMNDKNLNERILNYQLYSEPTILDSMVHNIIPNGYQSFKYIYKY